MLPAASRSSGERFTIARCGVNFSARRFTSCAPDRCHPNGGRDRGTGPQLPWIYALDRVVWSAQVAIATQPASKVTGTGALPENPAEGIQLMNTVLRNRLAA